MNATNEVSASPRLLKTYRGDRRFRVFAILWAVATLFHMAHSSIFDRQLNLALLTLAAFLVIFRPSLGSFLILIFLQVFDAIYRMPLTTNHWLFTAFANLTILHVAVLLMIRHRSFNIMEADLMRAFAPLLRAEVIILYSFAAFHKLNSDFLLASTSCASEFLKAQQIPNILPLTETALKANRYLTVIVEFALPVLLYFRSTRNIGILVGLFFHCVLSYSTYNAFYDFSSLMFAAYFLFMGSGMTDLLTRVLSWFRRQTKSILAVFSITRMVVIGIGIFLIVAVVYRLNLAINTSKSVHLYFFWTLYSIMFCALFILYVMSRKNESPIAVAHNFQPAHWSLYLMPLIIFLNGLSPYLGLKTENSYAMFSNLRTEGGITNHLIIPVESQIFDFQKDVVEITSSSDSLLQQMAVEKQAMVLFEFQNYVNKSLPDSVVYRINGQPGIFLERDMSSHAALGKNPYILRKVLKFRSFSLAGPQPCRH